MAVLRESPWYREIMREGERIGFLEGRTLGLQGGLDLGMVKAILQVLEARFGGGKDLDEVASALRRVQNFQVLRWLLVQAMEVKSLPAFKRTLDEVAPYPA